MRTVGLRPMTAHLRSVILIGPFAFAASGGFIAAALALPRNMVAPAIPERDPTNPLRVHIAIRFISPKTSIEWLQGSGLRCREAMYIISRLEKADEARDSVSIRSLSLCRALMVTDFKTC